MSFYTLNIRQRLLDLMSPKVMAVVNLTDDSFLETSRCFSGDTLVSRIDECMTQGADILDIGACSTRPGSNPVCESEEIGRLRWGLDIICKKYPSATLSVDTFRASVAEEVLKNYPVAIINDVSGLSDTDMLSVIAKYKVVYVLTYNNHDCGNGDIVYDAIKWLENKIDFLRQSGIKDIIIDPGFGFNKTVKDNYLLLRHLCELKVLGCPILVGVSHKSMFYKPLNLDAKDVLPASLTAQTIALQGGCNILRVHDVDDALQQVKTWQLLNCKL
ncbi:MAG: dihydropteroate synthase [Paludibacteraceae bacterium]|nr:dihydropteroate synthase [Paludibacteraceae bacterium]